MIAKVEIVESSGTSADGPDHGTLLRDTDADDRKEFSYDISVSRQYDTCNPI
jgi:hypothetical protein